MSVWVCQTLSTVTDRQDWLKRDGNALKVYFDPIYVLLSIIWQSKYLALVKESTSTWVEIMELFRSLKLYCGPLVYCVKWEIIKSFWNNYFIDQSGMTLISLSSILCHSTMTLQLCTLIMMDSQWTNTHTWWTLANTHSHT